VRKRPSVRAVLVVAGTIAASVAWACLLAAVARHIRFGSSDNANAALAGQAMLHGNPLLHGWEMPHNSYWLLDLPFFGVGSMVFGLQDGLMSAVPAMVATAGIAIGSVGAVIGRPCLKRWWVGTAVLVLLLGLPHAYLGLFLLQGPHHVATAVGCLAVFLLLAGTRFGTLRWLAGTAMLAAAVQSDPMAVAVGVVPVAGAGLAAALRTRRLGTLTGPAVAAAAAMAGAALLGALLRMAGGYNVLPDPPALAAWRENLGAVPHIFGGLLGATSNGGLVGAARAVHVAGAGLFMAGIAASAIGTAATLFTGRARTGTGWLDDALLLGFAGGVAAFALLTDPALQVVNARYLLPPLIFGAVLTARRAVEAAAALRWRPAGPIVAAGAVGLAALYAVSPLAIVRGPEPANPSLAVADWLAGRGLHNGLGQYWVAGLTTVSGRGHVIVRPVREVGGTLQANYHFASERWFDGRRHFRFVVVDRDHPDGVDEAAAATTFGAPAEGHDIGPYRVLLWDRDLTVRPDS
jgi:hypothetical protein